MNNDIPIATGARNELLLFSAAHIRTVKQRSAVVIFQIMYVSVIRALERDYERLTISMNSPCAFETPGARVVSW